ncbi:MAG TPA: hypothetical protein VFS90_18450, partial [Pyrinomonadaceae bacterium]|nr:hypothetical protein [Pyrinomonadaceae bacterium]
MTTPKACFSVLAALFMFLMFDVAVMGQTQVSPAQDIVFKMAERYAALSSYQDSGVVETVTEGPLARRGTDIYFKTNFTKPNKLRFEWIDYVSLASFERNAIWSDGKKASA